MDKRDEPDGASCIAVIVLLSAAGFLAFAIGSELKKAENRLQAVEKAVKELRADK